MCAKDDVFLAESLAGGCTWQRTAGWRCEWPPWGQRLGGAAQLSACFRADPCASTPTLCRPISWWSRWAV